MKMSGKAKCPHCGKGPTTIINSRHVSGWRWRRRLCKHCHVRWTTYEVPAALIVNLAKAVHLLNTTRTTLDELVSMVNSVPIMNKAEELDDELRTRLAMDTRSKR